MPRKVLEVTEYVQVNEDGETTRRDSKVKFKTDAEPEYIKLYLNTVLYLRSLPKGYNPILLAFLKRMSYASVGQKLYVNAEMKREIAQEIKVSLAYVNNAITDFVKGKLIFRVGTGTYQFNPQFFGRGDWSDIEAIRATITFNPDGTDFATEIIKTDKITANKKAIRHEPTAEQLEEVATVEVPIEEPPVAQEPLKPTCMHCGDTDLDYKPTGMYGAWYKCRKCGKGTSAEKRKGA